MQNFRITIESYSWSKKHQTHFYTIINTIIKMVLLAVYTHTNTHLHNISIIIIVIVFVIWFNTEEGDDLRLIE